MKRREFLKTATVAVAGSGAVVAAPAIVRAEESFSFKMTNAYPPNAPFYVAGPGSPTDFCKKVEAMSGGRLKIQHFAAGELIPALEGFDAIGRTRAADTKSVTFDGTAVEGLAGLRDYLANQRRADFFRQFSRKLLGYSLGRSAQLSDQPLIDKLTTTEGGHVGKMIEQIVRSPQFREIRGRDSISSNPPSFNGR